MKKIKGEKVSKMQQEVWKMKENIFKETKNMNSRSFFSYIKEKCKKLRIIRKINSIAFIKS